MNEIPDKSLLPDDYSSLLAEVKRQIATSRVRAVMAANAELVLLYWQIGRAISQRQHAHGWGAKIIDRLAADLKTAYPDMTGLSVRNLKYMKKFAESWPDSQIVQQLVAQIPWGHNLVLLDRLPDESVRRFYAERAIEHGWSRNVMTLQIESGLHQREGKAVTNATKKTVLPPNTHSATSTNPWPSPSGRPNSPGRSPRNSSPNCRPSNKSNRNYPQNCDETQRETHHEPLKRTEAKTQLPPTSGLINLRHTCDTTCHIGTGTAVFVPEQHPPKTIHWRLKKMEAAIASDLEELEAML